jgi:phosphoribosylglycinamide formyltransferase-1
MRIRIGVLASGRGTDFQSIIDGVECGRVNADIRLLITDNPDAKAIERARKHKIPFAVIERKNYKTREEHDRAIRKKLDGHRLDLVVLAGYMRIIRDRDLLRAYKGKMINIHPSLLPSFPGTHAQKDAFEFGSKVSGYTIHFVDESLDGGPIIYQEAVDISGCKSADEVSARILEREHVGLPAVIHSFSEGGYNIKGRRIEYRKRGNPLKGD